MDGDDYDNFVCVSVCVGACVSGREVCERAVHGSENGLWKKSSIYFIFMSSKCASDCTANQMRQHSITKTN